MSFSPVTDALPSSLVLLTDPRSWTKAHVIQWLQWAVSEFSLVNVNFSKFDLDGQMLCDLGKECFLELAPDFVGDILWEHLEQMMKGTACPQPAVRRGRQGSLNATERMSFRFMSSCVSLCSADCQEKEDAQNLSGTVPSGASWMNSPTTSECYSFQKPWENGSGVACCVGGRRGLAAGA